MPSCFIRSVMFGRWFHIAVARSTNERGRIARARSGATLPPTPLTEWHFTQPLEPNTRDPASGSWLGLITGWAQIASSDTKNTATVRTVHLRLRIIGEPFICHWNRDNARRYYPGPPVRTMTQMYYLAWAAP